MYRAATFVAQRRTAPVSPGRDTAGRPRFPAARWIKRVADAGVPVHLPCVLSGRWLMTAKDLARSFSVLTAAAWPVGFRPLL